MTQPLLDVGVEAAAYEPVQRLLGARINMLRRMHHKMVVVDGGCAFVGGINYSIDHLAESGKMAKQDYAIEIAGPLVGQIRAFCRAACTCRSRAAPGAERWRREARPRAPAARTMPTRRPPAAAHGGVRHARQRGTRATSRGTTAPQCDRRASA